MPCGTSEEAPQLNVPRTAFVFCPAHLWASLAALSQASCTESTILRIWHLGIWAHRGTTKAANTLKNEIEIDRYRTLPLDRVRVSMNVCFASHGPLYMWRTLWTVRFSWSLRLMLKISTVACTSNVHSQSGVVEWEIKAQ